MARVNVETQALNDPRFRILGSHLSPLTKASQEMVETAFGLFIMVRVWNYCMEREILVVPVRELDAIYPGLTDAMIDAQLGEFTPDSNPPSVRIKGGTGRLDWLKRARLNGKEFGPSGAKHGSKGGRPRKTPKGVSKKRGRGLQNNPPLTLTLTPSLSPSLSPTLTPAPAPARTRVARAKKQPFVIPSVVVVSAYCAEIGTTVDPQRFVDYYEANGWKVGRNAMKDWKAAVRTWHKNEQERGSQIRNAKPTLTDEFNAGMIPFLAKGKPQ